MDERREACIAHQEKTEDLKKAVFGNGRPGLTYDMAQIKVTNKIILTLQTLMLCAIIKIVFFGGVT